jgi:uncharacterized protein YifE (UPF0438 family)
MSNGGGKHAYGGKQFHGKIEELGDNVFIYGVKNQGDKYIKTKEAIADYVGREYGKAMRQLVLGKDNPPTEPKEPPKPDKDAVSFAIKKFERLWSHYLHKLDKYHEDKAKVFFINLGQMTPTMKNKVESLANYKDLEDNDDVVGLLSAMKDLAFSTVSVQYEYWNMVNSVKKVVILQQGTNEPLPGYYRRWTTARDITEEQWGPWTPPKLAKASSDTDAEVRNKFQACAFLAGVDKVKYGKVINELNNSFLAGNNSYPPSVRSSTWQVGGKANNAIAAKIKSS